MKIQAYRLFAYLGSMSVAASVIAGFRYDALAPVSTLKFNLLLYAVFAAVHIVMTMPAFKGAVYGNAQGTPAERRIYVAISIITWLAVYALHQPTAGFQFHSPEWLRFVGLCGALVSLFAFFEYATFAHMDMLLGVPGAELSHTVGAETPLMTEGSYAQVRHPMYRAMLFLCLSSLLIHPNSGQLLFTVLIAGTFVLFIPFEEYQLAKARGDAYRQYMKDVPYRVLKGIW